MTKQMLTLLGLADLIEEANGAPMFISEQASIEIRLLDEMNVELLRSLIEIISQIDQGGSGGKVFAHDYCITQARTAINKATGETR
jgi:hypothetical protein